MKSSSNIINIVARYSNTSKDGSNFLLTIGALSINIELNEIENTLDVFEFLINKYALPITLSIEEVKKFLEQLSDSKDIFKCEEYYQHLQFNTETGELLLINQSIKGCSINVFKYIEKIQSLLNF